MIGYRSTKIPLETGKCMKMFPSIYIDFYLKKCCFRLPLNYLSTNKLFWRLGRIISQFVFEVCWDCFSSFSFFFLFLVRFANIVEIRIFILRIWSNLFVKTTVIINGAWICMKRLCLFISLIKYTNMKKILVYSLKNLEISFWRSYSIFSEFISPERQVYFCERWEGNWGKVNEYS